MKIRLVHNEVEGMLKEKAVALFVVLSWHFPRGTEENQEQSQSRQPVSGTRYESEASQI
jgi:hypothetical protein